MSEETVSRFAYFFPFHGMPQKLKTVSTGSGTLSLRLPDEVDPRILAVDPKDRRVLIVFDGVIPSGGLPQACSILDSAPCRVVRIQTEHAYKQRHPVEEPLTYSVRKINGRMYAEQEIARHILLSPHKESCLRRYHNKTLRPHYVCLEILNGKKDGLIVRLRRVSTY
ncbi:MAG: hypothetical protein HYS44_02400 [Candidatus Niyogibacteria bacterium]|nr:hypothetical protein [Candidatus Niyogibacteria bacterium]